jgi:hypothetical protein
MGAAAAQRARDRFDQQHQIDLTLDTYRRLLPERCPVVKTSPVALAVENPTRRCHNSPPDLTRPAGPSALPAATGARLGGADRRVAGVGARRAADWSLRGLTSRGPVLFRQERVGLNGDPFEVYKFRSMVDGDNPLVPDPTRITRVGAVLRRWSLDELPQLLNVAKGEMSAVGPSADRRLAGGALHPGAGTAPDRAARADRPGPGVGTKLAGVGRSHRLGPCLC